MHIYDIDFSNGKRCRCLVMEPESEEVDQSGIRSIFRDGQITNMQRIIAPPPERLPWRRDGQVWRIGRFELRKLDGGEFVVTWPGGEVRGGKDAVSEAVRRHWREGV